MYGVGVDDQLMTTASQITYPIARPFSWYALVYPDGSAYKNHLLPLGTCSDMRGFCQYWNHIPKPGEIFDGLHAWRIATQHFGYGICFFEEETQPEWEHPNNVFGTDLVCRRTFRPSELSDAWQTLLLMMVSGDLECATGIRVVYKKDRRGVITHKLEVWCRTDVDVSELIRRLKENVGFDFIEVPRRQETSLQVKYTSE